MSCLRQYRKTGVASVLGPRELLREKWKECDKDAVTCLFARRQRISQEGKFGLNFTFQGD
jgi:hypothetical protein